MKKIMCLIGLHKWKYEHMGLLGSKRTCDCCNKKQTMHELFVNLYTGDPIITWKTE